jgi:hypothetical protein
MTYADFLHRKAQLADAGGFDPTHLPDHLFNYQRDLVTWAVRHGRGALFADCGLGKTPMELAWADQVAAHTRKLDKFNWNDYGGVICDESSAIKSFDGKRRAVVTEFMRRIQYRLLGTATAAPNDYIELGTSSEALGALGHMDMLTRFFVNDARSVASRGRSANGQTIDWRLKGHAEEPFWRWVSSWARAMRRPSDYGYDDGPFILPDLHERTTVVTARTPRDDILLDLPAVGLQEERAENRRTLTERCETAAAILDDATPGIAWCHLNAESELLTRIIPGAVEISGAADPDEKEDKLAAFTRGEVRVLVTKPSIGAWGLNWQHCHRMTYFPSHSYEQMYQATRRLYRFGQKNPVTVDYVTSEGGKNILANLKRKATQADAMFTNLVTHMNAARTVDPHRYDNDLEMPSWLVS